MATVRKMWRCTNRECKNEVGKNRGYKKVCTGEKEAKCKHCLQPMKLSDTNRTRIMKDGQTFTRSKGLTNKGDAEAHLATCITSRHSGALMPGEERLIPWSEAEKLFLATLDARLLDGKSKTTDDTYRHRVRTLAKTFGKRVLQSIERFEVEDWRDARKKKVGASDIRCTLSVLDMIYSKFLDRYSSRRFPRLQEAANDIAKVVRPDLPPGRDNILETEEQMQALLDECKSPVLYHFVYGILNTGLRHSDMLKLRACEIQWNRNEIVTTVKGKKLVRIPLTDNYRLFLKNWILRTKPTKQGWLFPSRMKPESCYTKQSRIGFAEAIERCAVRYEGVGDKVTAERFRNLHPHDLRHTFATHFLYKASKEMGGTAAVHVLSQALGHTTSYITQRYSHALDEINQAAMKAFGQQMFGNIKTINLFQSL